MMAPDDDNPESVSQQERSRQHKQKIDRGIGKNIRLCREAVGLSLEELAELCALSSRQLKSYEAGLARAPPAALATIAEVLGISVGYFFLNLDI
jgi:ribosome-binding protein aMBF1 (putative translation factor)